MDVPELLVCRNLICGEKKKGRKENAPCFTTCTRDMLEVIVVSVLLFNNYFTNLMRLPNQLWCSLSLHCRKYSTHSKFYKFLNRETLINNSFYLFYQ